MYIAETIPDPWAIPIEQIDVSNPALLAQDAWRPFFERLRKEAPVHYQANSPFGPFWSITKFDDIVAICLLHSC